MTTLAGLGGSGGGGGGHFFFLKKPFLVKAGLLNTERSLLQPVF